MRKNVDDIPCSIFTSCHKESFRAKVDKGRMVHRSGIENTEIKETKTTYKISILPKNLIFNEKDYIPLKYFNGIKFHECLI